MTDAGRFALLPRLGIEPTFQSIVHDALDAAIRAAEIRSPGSVTVLDAGCGRISALRGFPGREWASGQGGLLATHAASSRRPLPGGG